MYTLCFSFQHSDVLSLLEECFILSSYNYFVALSLAISSPFAIESMLGLPRLAFSFQYFDPHKAQNPLESCCIR